MFLLVPTNYRRYIYIHWIYGKSELTCAVEKKFDPADAKAVPSMLIVFSHMPLFSVERILKWWYDHGSAIDESGRKSPNYRERRSVHNVMIDCN